MSTDDAIKRINEMTKNYDPRPVKPMQTQTVFLAYGFDKDERYEDSSFFIGIFDTRNAAEEGAEATFMKRNQSANYGAKITEVEINKLYGI